MLDTITNLLFEDSFPREVGRKRFLCRTKQEFEEKVDLMNGFDDVFTNINPIDGSINKISFDLDDPLRCDICAKKGIVIEGHKDVMSEHFKVFHNQEYILTNRTLNGYVTQLPLSLAEAQQLYCYLLSKKIPTFHAASGKKGIHFHCKFERYKGEDAKTILYNTSKSILVDCFGVDKDGIIKSRCVDTHLIGNVRALIRIAGTLRPPENQSYCTFLPPNKGFLEMTNEDLRWYIKGIHNYNLTEYPDYNPIKLPKFQNFILPEIEKAQFNMEQEYCAANVPLDNTKDCIDSELLKFLLKNRPCIYRVNAVQEPRHPSRVALVALLKAADFTPREIMNLLRPLRWVDWSEEYTEYQIGRVKPMVWGKKTLARKGICYKCGKCQ